MHEAHYGLRQDPFRLTPDPAFRYRHRSYQKAEAYVRYALDRREGLILVTGAPGLGKTTLVTGTLADLDPASTVIRSLTTAQIGEADFLQMVAHAFELSPDGRGKGEVLRRIETFLDVQQRSGRRCILLVDEAQALAPSALEELRLLTNLQREGAALLQILLLGHEELRDIVRRPSLEQLRQRLIATCHLEPLDLEEIAAYVRHRLGVAGWTGRPRITAAAVRSVARTTGGVPRRINHVMSRLLLYGALEGCDELGETAVQTVVGELAAEGLLIDGPAALADALPDEVLAIDRCADDEPVPVSTVTVPAPADVPDPVETSPAQTPRAPRTHPRAHPDKTAPLAGEVGSEECDALPDSAVDDAHEAAEVPELVVATRPATGSEAAGETPSVPYVGATPMDAPRAPARRREPGRSTAGIAALLALTVAGSALVSPERWLALGALAPELLVRASRLWTGEAPPTGRGTPAGQDAATDARAPAALPTRAVQVVPATASPAGEARLPDLPAGVARAHGLGSAPRNSDLVVTFADPGAASGAAPALVHLQQALTRESLSPDSVAANTVRIRFGGDDSFSYGSADLTARVLGMLDRLARLLDEDESRARVRVVGHSDDVGAEPLNLEMSRKRAAAVAEALVARGLDIDRVSIEAKGSSEPLVSNLTADGRRRNRRVELYLSVAGSEAVRLSARDRDDRSL